MLFLDVAVLSLGYSEWFLGSCLLLSDSCTVTSVLLECSGWLLGCCLSQGSCYAVARVLLVFVAW